MNKFIIAAAAMVCCLIGCKNEIIDCVPLNFPLTTEFGWLGAEKNGHTFMASAKARRDWNKPNYFWIGFGTVNRYFETQEEFGIFEIPLKRGKFTVKRPVVGTALYDGFPRSSYLTTIDDVPEDRYQIDENEENFIEIVSIDSSFTPWNVRGKLQLTYQIASTPKNDKSNPDVIQFTNGEFEFKFIE